MNPLNLIKYLPKEKKEKIKIKGKLRMAWVYTFKPKLRKAYDKLQIVNQMPRPVLIVLLIFTMLIISIFNNNIMTKRWRNDVVAAYPDLTNAVVDEDGAVHLSPLDSLFTQFVARNQAIYFVELSVILSMILRSIWLSFNPRKPQSLHLRGLIRGE